MLQWAGGAPGPTKPSKLSVWPRARPVRVPLVRYRKLGDSELEVSEISLGSWLTFGGGVERDQTGLE